MDVGNAEVSPGRGNNVVATGRDAKEVAEALRTSVNLPIVKPDITKPTDARKPPFRQL
jgi:hypothetical protein